MQRLNRKVPIVGCAVPELRLSGSLSSGPVGLCVWAGPGAAPVQRVRTRSERGVQAMVDVPSALSSENHSWARLTPASLTPFQSLGSVIVRFMQISSTLRLQVRSNHLCAQTTWLRRKRGALSFFQAALRSENEPWFPKFGITVTLLGFEQNHCPNPFCLGAVLA